MTNAAIIKALECCGVMSGDCENCPSKYRRRSDCIHILTRDVIDLINRQQAEIERLKSIEPTEEVRVKCEEVINKIRAEAVREFAEVMKENLKNVAKVEIMGCEYYPIGLTFIDNLVSEMFGNPEQVKGETNI